VTRQPGFYWVRDSDGWTVAHWGGDCWDHPGSEIEWLDCDYSEIDERRIERE